MSVKTLSRRLILFTNRSLVHWSQTIPTTKYLFAVRLWLQSSDTLLHLITAPANRKTTQRFLVNKSEWATTSKIVSMRYQPSTQNRPRPPRQRTRNTKQKSLYCPIPVSTMIIISGESDAVLLDYSNKSSQMLRLLVTSFAIALVLQNISL